MKFFILIIFLLFFACSPKLVMQAPEPLNAIERLLSASELLPAHTGLLVCDAETGQVLFSHQADKLFMPASNMKLLTTAAALYQLGADYRFTTQIVLNGMQQDSIFYGDIEVVGGGDPTFCEYYHPDSFAVFSELIQPLKARGIRIIYGKIIPNLAKFSDQQLGTGWSWENEPFRFSARISPLSCYENSVRVILQGDEIGMPASVDLFPNFDNVRITSDVTVSSDQNTIQFHRNPGNEIHFYGMVPLGVSDTSYCTVENPVELFESVFASELKLHGICLHANIDTLTFAFENCDTLTHVSLPLAGIIKAINTESRNLDAELLFRTMGFEKYGIGDEKYSIQAVNEFLVSIGIDTTALRIVDGSGLSRKNLLSPQAIVKLLLWMHHAPDSQVFRDSFPLAGKNGTIEHYYTLTGHVAAKTGTLDAVKCLSGYVQTDSGKTLIFSIMMNHYTASHQQIVGIQQKICEYLLTIE